MTTAAAEQVIQQAPDRWQKALDRANKEGVFVAQVNVTGAWVANSGTKPGLGYQLELRNGSLTCSCAASNWDGLCKHKARWFHLHGMLADQSVTA